MDTMKLMDALGGHVLANKARATVDGKVVIIGRLYGDKWVTTDAGAKLAAELNSKSAPAAKNEQKAAKPKASKQVK